MAIILVVNPRPRRRVFGLLRSATGGSSWVRVRTVDYNDNSVSDKTARIRATRTIVLYSTSSGAIEFISTIWIKSGWINEVHWIVLRVGIAVERLRVSEVITAIRGIGLYEAMPFTCVAAHHGVVAAVAISFVGCVAMRLEGLVAAACSLTTPGIEIYCARNCAGAVSYTLTLRDRILMHPTPLIALLNGQQLIPEIYIAAQQGAAATNLTYYLTTQDTGAQVVRRSALNFLHAQPITIIALGQRRARCVSLLTSSIISIALIAVVDQISGRVIAHRRTSPRISH